MPGPPSNPFSGIFVCYRRHDSAGHAGRLFDRLNAHFGVEQIFMDIDYIEPGEDFVQVIENAVGSCEILIAIIGRNWLSSAVEGSRRLDNPRDSVRLEIVAALDRGIRIVPVLVQDARMPTPQHLPEDLSKLSRYNAFELSDRRWQRDVGLLISVLERIFKQREEERSRNAVREEERRRAADAQLEADESERLKLEAEEVDRRKDEAARVLAEEEAQLHDKAEARMKAAVEAAARRRTEAEARLAEMEARLHADLEASARAEEEAERLGEEVRRRAEENARRRAKTEARLIEEEMRLQTEEGRAKATGGGQHRPVGTEDYISKLKRWMSAAGLWRPLKEPQTAREKREQVIQWEFQKEGPVATEAATEPRKVIGIVPVVNEDAEIPSEILERLSSPEASERQAALADLVFFGDDEAFRCISRAFDDHVEDVRNAAAQALFDLQPDVAATFTRALREGSPARRRNIGQALAGSGLAAKAIGNLTGESREKTYDAFSLLFLMAKAGEVQPLMQAIEDYPNVEVRIVAVKLLALSGQPEIIPAFRRLAVRGAIPSEVRSSIMEAIFQISSQARESGPPSRLVEESLD